VLEIVLPFRTGMVKTEYEYEYEYEYEQEQKGL
jgi:hypothetical protein